MGESTEWRVNYFPLCPIFKSQVSGVAKIIYITHQRAHTRQKNKTTTHHEQEETNAPIYLGSIQSAELKWGAQAERPKSGARGGAHSTYMHLISPPRVSYFVKRIPIPTAESG